MTDQTPIPEGFMRDAKGNMVALANVKDEDKLEDELVDRLCQSAENLHQVMSNFKEVALSEAMALRDLVAERYDVKIGGKKGNMTLRTFDGRYELQVAVADRLVFGPELQAAKELIDDCLTRWSEGSNENLHALVNDAFNVGKENQIDTKRVLSLRRLKMDDVIWDKAMEAISDAVRVASSKTYLRFYKIDQETGVRTPISLDLAAI